MKLFKEMLANLLEMGEYKAIKKNTSNKDTIKAAHDVMHRHDKPKPPAKPDPNKKKPEKQYDPKTRYKEISHEVKTHLKKKGIFHKILKKAA